MSAIDQPIDPNLLRRLVPLNSLNREHLDKLARQTPVESVAAGRVLFEEGAVDPYSIYLLAGEVILESRKSSITRTLVGGSEEARYALANLRPRQFSGTAKTAVTLIRLDAQLLDTMLTWDQVSGIEVTELTGDTDDSGWMMKILQTGAFLKLPPANIQTLFGRLEQIPVKSGQIVIKQGETGDYYYIVKRGRCRVVRMPSHKSAAAVLADLGEGDSFGEEALISQAPRNATVAMLSDGVLMRLAKSDFEALLKEPLLNWVGARQGVEMVHTGAALLDVRLDSEHRNGCIRDSMNIPLSGLRASLDSLDRNRKYVVYCDTGSRSSAAAFIMGQRGYDAYVLQGGLNALIGASQGGAP